MIVEKNFSLRAFNTFGFEVAAEYFIDATTDDNVVEAIAWARKKNLPIFVLGGGSNIVLGRNIPGLVIHLRTTGVRTISESASQVCLSIKAGENWHGLVTRCIAENRFGLENLSLIPGSVGAAPIQNIGAYGVELSERFISLQAIDKQTAEPITLDKIECAFAYRDSIFKHQFAGQFLITDVTLMLDKQFSPNIDYGNVRQLLRETTAELPTAREVSKVICKIRRSKLPDPSVLGNAGSFFTNPIVSATQYQQLKEQFPGIVGFPTQPGKCKLAAAWLVEKCGWKGYAENGVGVHSQQSLVLVNHGDGTGLKILALAEKIKQSVLEKFGVQLCVEPQIV